MCLFLCQLGCSSSFITLARRIFDLKIDLLFASSFFLVSIVVNPIVSVSSCTSVGIHGYRKLFDSPDLQEEIFD